MTVHDNEDRPRIHLRLRPPRSDFDEPEGDETFQICTSTGQIQYNAKHGMRSKTTTTRFDNVFETSAPSSQVYRVLKEDIGRSLEEGWQMILAFYGQTGSGKTHSHDGVLLPILEQVFKAQPERVSLQYVQLYVDNLEDLLAEDNPTLELKETADSLGPRDALAVSISSAKRGMQVFRQAAARRNVAQNGINVHSSRSHAFLYIHVEWSDRQTCIVMADLAGSERVGQLAACHGVDQAEEAMMKRKSFARMDKDDIPAGIKLQTEGNSINKGLSQLGLCVDRCSRREYIPWRDSKLTQLFKPIWSGRGMMHMTLCVDTTDAVESQSTIDFGSRCLKLDVKPVQNRKKVTATTDDVDARITSIVSEYKAKLAEKDDALARLRRQIERLRAENAEQCAQLAGKDKAVSSSAAPLETAPTPHSMCQYIRVVAELRAEVRHERAVSAQLGQENKRLREEMECLRQRMHRPESGLDSDSRRQRQVPSRNTTPRPGRSPRNSDAYELFERVRQEQRGLWEQNDKAEEAVRKLLEETPGLEGELRVALENRLVMEEQVESISRRVQELLHHKRMSAEPEEQERLAEDIARFQDREMLARNALKQVCDQISAAQKKYNVSDEVLGTIDIQLNKRLWLRSKLEEGDQRCKQALNELREECKGNSNKVSEIAEAYAHAIQRIEASCNTIFELRLQSEGLQLALSKLANGEHVQLLKQLNDQASVHLQRPAAVEQAATETEASECFSFDDGQDQKDGRKPADVVLQAEVNERRELLSQLKKLDGELMTALSNEAAMSEPENEPTTEAPVSCPQAPQPRVATDKRSVPQAPSLTKVLPQPGETLQVSSSTVARPPLTLGPRPFVSLREAVAEDTDGGRRRSVTPSRRSITPSRSSFGEAIMEPFGERPMESIVQLRAETKRLKKREVELQCLVDCMGREVHDLQEKLEKAKQRTSTLNEKHLAEVAQLREMLAAAHMEVEQKDMLLERARFERKEWQRRLTEAHEAQKVAAHEAQRQAKVATQEEERVINALKEMMGKGAQMLDIMSEQKRTPRSSLEHTPRSNEEIQGRRRPISRPGQARGSARGARRSISCNNLRKDSG